MFTTKWMDQMQLFRWLELVEFLHVSLFLQSSLFDKEKCFCLELLQLSDAVETNSLIGHNFEYFGQKTTNHTKHLNNDFYNDNYTN